MLQFIKKQPPARIIACGFIFVILLGSLLLSLPYSIKDNVDVNYIDALYTSTSAVCVTGLMTIDAGDTFTIFGQVVLAVLIQIGGLGVMTIGTGIIMAMRKKIDIKNRVLIRESMNLDSTKGAIKFLRSVFLTTLAFEFIGMILSFIVFIQDFPIGKAAWVSLFHSIAAFNNAGIDVLGGFKNLQPYQSNVLLILVTAALIFFGGIGFLVIREIISKKFRWKKFSMHTKVVLSVSFTLILAGTLLIWLTEDITWLGAFFHSVSARTAGFSSYSMGGFSNAGIMIIMILMFIGASPGSTGGGVKTTSFFVILQGIKSAATNKSEKAFKYSIPSNAFRKAAIIILIAFNVIIIGTFLLMVMEPNVPLKDALFEIISAFGTVGLSTGITTQLGTGAKILSMIIMYIGRLGPLTIATLWYFNKGERMSYPEGNIAIG